MVRPKKFLGQHFLKDQNIAAKIVEALVLPSDKNFVLEIGPGTGVLTKLLREKPGVDLHLAEIDRESVSYLKEHYPDLSDKITEGDFLKMNLSDLTDKNIHIIGNFPYNISSQIFFKVLEQRNKVSQVVCMLQKEVADRIAEKEGSKTYGILSVLLQTFYTIEYLFKVPPGVFFPPPKVMSAVIRLTRNDRAQLPCSEQLFFKVVKQAFQNRRKTLRNALKPLNLPAQISALATMDLRAEQLSVEEFILLTQKIEQASEGVRSV
ncbi:MAG TPA: 16S rRNA (adenine(1518)-N(6)/adenine(1519)-N(6))-dimethyltransferase RsmA [Cyclobacteriaceae bacterium]|jgi:16S rRNA (adenine1518-N6/adenine1519-N6)-dimethyltransferase|nr:16S rRNA (adenine(1518)-N(6)/adenine(1519)-N(6))-dimethyltransferase RsmA [Cyclobacteriaceae bacterium]